MSPTAAFVNSTSFLGRRTAPPALSAPRTTRIAVAPSRRVVAVLDTPASNTHLQRNGEVILRDFLTRRAVHTIMFYMAELGDRPTRQWLANFDSFSDRVAEDRFDDADGFLDKMMRTQRIRGSIKMRHPRGYFSRTYPFVIEPHRIAKRIVATRVQLAEEWATDLRCIQEENLEIQRMAFEKMVCSDDKVLASKQNIIFDSDPFGSNHTPLRYKNYMALKLLITQHAITRLLPFLRDQGSNHEYMYLLQFVNTYGPLEKGDEFLRTLMACPIETRTNPTHTIQPKSIALQIMELRRVIADEWISVMQCIPDEQMLMAREMLESSMEASNEFGEDVPRPKNAAEAENEDADVDTVA